MVAAAFFTLCSAGVFASYTMSLKSQRSASYNVTLYAFANSINDQICGLGYTEVDAAVNSPTVSKPVLAINNPTEGKLIQVAIQFGKRFEFKANGVDANGNTGDYRLKTDYTLHSGLSANKTDGTFSMIDLAANSGTYTTVRNLGATVTVTRIAPTLPAYLVSTTVDYSDGAGTQTKRITVSRVVSNINGYSYVR